MAASVINFVNISISSSEGQKIFEFMYDNCYHQNIYRVCYQFRLSMAEFFNILSKLLINKQMSISSIARELKKSGYDQHRLILTGYLRALNDMGYLEEINIPPSKVYKLKSGIKRDVYAIVKEQLKDIELSERFELAVYVLSSLFHRPCFKYELELMGLEPKRTETVKESKDARLKEHRAAITRIKIPGDDPAFEISGNHDDIQIRGNKILIEIIHELLDLEGLKAKFQQTKLA